jgi:predicted RNase H-like HicB family nuclease
MGKPRGRNELKQVSRLLSSLPHFTASHALFKLKAVKEFTLEYWIDDGWYVGRLKKIPALMSQGATLEELPAMIRDAYRLIVDAAAENTFTPKRQT